VEKFTQEPDTLATKSGQRQWLNERAPAWLVPSSFALAAAEAAAIIAQAALLAWILSWRLRDPQLAAAVNAINEKLGTGDWPEGAGCFA